MSTWLRMCTQVLSTACIYFIHSLCKNLSQWQKELWFCFCSYHFLILSGFLHTFSYWILSYILRPLSMGLSSQVKRRSHSRKVEVIEPNGVWRTPACQELNIISKQSRKAASQRPLGFLCLLIQARPTWQLSCQAYQFCLVCLFLSHSPWLTYLCKTQIPQLAISGSYL